MDRGLRAHKKAPEIPNAFTYLLYDPPDVMQAVAGAFFQEILAAAATRRKSPRCGL